MTEWWDMSVRKGYVKKEEKKRKNKQLPRPAGLRDRLGAFFSPMLEQMTDRGPDSAGVAIYRDTENASVEAKVTLYDSDPDFDWNGVASAASGDLEVAVTAERVSSHAILRALIDAGSLRRCRHLGEVGSRGSG